MYANTRIKKITCSDSIQMETTNQENRGRSFLYMNEINHISMYQVNMDFDLFYIVKILGRFLFRLFLIKCIKTLDIYV